MRHSCSRGIMFVRVVNSSKCAIRYLHFRFCKLATQRAGGHLAMPAAQICWDKWKKWWKHQEFDDWESGTELDCYKNTPPNTALECVWHMLYVLPAFVNRDATSGISCVRNLFVRSPIVARSWSHIMKLHIHRFVRSSIVNRSLSRIMGLHIHKGWSTAITEYISITVQQGSVPSTLSSCNELFKVMEHAGIKVEGAVSNTFYVGIQSSGINDIQIHPWFVRGLIFIVKQN